MSSSQLHNLAGDAIKEYRDYYIGSGILLHFKRLLRYKKKYIIRGFARLGILRDARFGQTKTFWGRDFFVMLADSNAGPLYYFGILAHKEHRLIKFLIKILESNDVFYDIGASYGFYTVLAEELLKNGEVHSFEPNPLVFRCVEKTFNEADTRVYLNNTALSDRSGSAPFFDAYKGRHSGGSTMIESIAARDPQKYTGTKIVTTTLDEYVQIHSLPTVIKMDVEGSEYMVIKGGRRTLERRKPLIIMEVGSNDWYARSSQTIDMLYELGYKSYGINEDGNLYEAHKSSIKHWVDDMKYDNFVFKTD